MKEKVERLIGLMMLAGAVVTFSSPAMALPSCDLACNCSRPCSTPCLFGIEPSNCGAANDECKTSPECSLLTAALPARGSACTPTSSWQKFLAAVEAAPATARAETTSR